ncbi:hypothetical protein [Polyangium sorediatum]|uniref:Type I restriction enzyme R protein N-terminal domain-containing protein n=1 Tax=Polyangium sorediatum TaxID=889274 RepID=A0ABT6PAI3_9BACT|nr:hypothetical protein [Polyangium sorediatum]MDI1437267.1 hypothetical protein [Polyangium sorediatum]
MPSLSHEAIVELFRNRPVLAAEILREAFDVALPSFTEARIESAELGDVMPRELRADLLVLLLDGKPVLAIIVEAQLHPPKQDKSFAWPAYLVGARARYKCPACLLLVTPDPALATRLAEPIVLGPGQAVITPFVLGPAGVRSWRTSRRRREGRNSRFCRRWRTGGRRRRSRWPSLQ